MLFSEPKIPQSETAAPQRRARSPFSALQRAENSSICLKPKQRAFKRRFQCSSASRKFLNIPSTLDPDDEERNFQCSSASRKFLNGSSVGATTPATNLSVLFSEPKIPQSSSNRSAGCGGAVFQCSSASRKFLNAHSLRGSASASNFQCSSASRKFLNFCEELVFEIGCVAFSALQRAENSSICDAPHQRLSRRALSVLFSEPKIPQFFFSLLTAAPKRFQCSSASRKFLNGWSG